MKHLFSFLALIALIALCATPMQQVAQAAGDTLSVAALPAGNINTVINSDTVAGGLRAHPDRVYKLRRGSVYQVTEPIKVNGSLHIIANDSSFGGNPVRPPVLAPAILGDNSSVDHFFNLIGKGGKVTMDNMYLLAVRADQAPLGFCQAIRVNADSISLRLRGIVFDAWVESGIRVNSHWTKANVQDCMFKNHQHSSSYYAGQPFMTENYVAMDTVKFINNTFFCNNSYSFSIRGFGPKTIFEHNTMVYGVVNPFLTRQAQNMAMNNNLFYGMHAWGGFQEDVWWGGFLQNPDTVSSTIILLRAKGTWNNTATAGPEVYVDSSHGVYANMVLASDRWLEVRNNVYNFPTKLSNFYQAFNDTTTQYYDSLDYWNGGKAYHLKKQLIKPKFVSGLVQATLDSIVPAQGGHAVRANNLDTDPGFNATITNQLDKMIAYVSKLVNGTMDSTWYFNPTGSLYPPTWPMTENFAYSNTALQTHGTDGFPVGDLNWFPAKKALWLLTDVRPVDNAVPDAFTLDQNFPNPFNPTTQISFTLKSNEQVSLVVYNMLGQQIRTLVNQEMPAGGYVAKWDGRDEHGFQMASGAYVYRLQTKSLSMTRTMMLLK
jgi:hypothetical protein